MRYACRILHRPHRSRPSARSRCHGKIYQIGQGNHRRRREKNEKLTARAVPVPFLQAEEDRRYHRRGRRDAVEEKIMEASRGGRAGRTSTRPPGFLRTTRSAQDHLTKDDPSAFVPPQLGRCTVVICITYKTTITHAGRLACGPGPTTPPLHADDSPWPRIGFLTSNTLCNTNFDRRPVPALPGDPFRPSSASLTAPAHVPSPRGAPRTDPASTRSDRAGRLGAARINRGGIRLR